MHCSITYWDCLSVHLLGPLCLVLWPKLRCWVTILLDPFGLLFTCCVSDCTLGVESCFCFHPFDGFWEGEEVWNGTDRKDNGLNVGFCWCVVGWLTAACAGNGLNCGRTVRDGRDWRDGEAGRGAKFCGDCAGCSSWLGCVGCTWAEVGFSAWTGCGAGFGAAGANRSCSAVIRPGWLWVLASVCVCVTSTATILTSSSGRLKAGRTTGARNRVFLSSVWMCGWPACAWAWLKMTVCPGNWIGKKEDKSRTTFSKLWFS